VMERTRVADMADRLCSRLSKGYRQRVGLAQAIIHNPDVLILDEPTNTLDVPSARELRAHVRELNASGKTVVYTTHIMAEAETLCERVAIIDHGQVIDLGTVDELKRSLRRDHVTHIEGIIPERASQAVAALPQVTKLATSVANGTTRLTVVSSDGRAALPRMIEALTTHGALIQNIAPEEVTLEDVFVAKTGRSLTEDTRVH